MRVVFIAVLCLAVGIGLGWQGQVRAASHQSSDTPIRFGDTAVMGAINEKCLLTNAGGVPTALCQPRTPRVGQLIITIQRHRLFVEKETKDGSGGNAVFMARQPTKPKPR
jgi:hypothetical protein